MYTACAWCGLDLGEKAPYEDTTTSHGICRGCAKQHFRLTDAQIDRALQEEASAA